MDKSKVYAAVEKFAAKGQFDKAGEQLEAILRADPTDLKALNRAADLYLKIESNEKAIDYLKRIGQVYTKDGFYSKAVAVYKRILKLEGGASKAALIEIHEQLASLYGQLGLVSDAMAHFAIVVDYFDTVGEQESLLRVLKKVSDLDPYNVDSQLKLAELFLAQSRQEEAKETLLRLDESVRPRGNLAEIVRIYERWVEMFPQDIERLQGLVDICLKANEPKKALARIQVAFRTDPRNADVLELLSSTFFALKQPEKARSVDFELVKIYRQAGDEEKCKVVEDRIQQKVAPSLPPPAAAMAGVGSSMGDDAISEDPGEALANQMELSAAERKVLSECEVYFKYGLAEKAYDVLQTQLTQYPESIPVRWKLKKAAQELNRRDELIQLLSEVLMLAKSKKLQSWVDLAAHELQPLDPNHPSLMGVVGAVAPTSNRPIENKQNENEPTRAKPPAAEEMDFEVSEISIDVGDLEIEDSVSEIKINEKSDPIVLETLDLEPSVEAPLKAPQAPAKPVAAEPVKEEESDAVFLSESDFSQSELESLSSALELEPTIRSTGAPMELSSVDVEVEKKAELKPEEISDVLELNSDVSAEGSEEDFEIRQGLEEVAFFKSQGMTAEADAVLKGLKSKFPHRKDWNLSDANARVSQVVASPEVLPAAKPTASPIKKKVAEVNSLGTKMKFALQEDDRDEAGGDFFDLADELNQEIENELKGEKISSNVPTEVKDVFKAFKKGISDTVSEEDWETHFDLGVAYREMGLMDDAVEEFTLVSKVVDQRPKALYQLGICEMNRSNFAKAKEIFTEALKSPKIGADEKISLTYELAEALLNLNDMKTAKKLFAEVQKIDPEFREVTTKLQKLA